MNFEEWTEACAEAHDELSDERAYDRAQRRHAQRQASEDRDTGEQLEPMPAFEEWIGGHDDDGDDDE